MADRIIGVIEVSADAQIRLTLTTDRTGARIIDARSFDRQAGVWMPNRRGVEVPVAHGETFARLAGEAVAAGGAE